MKIRRSLLAGLSILVILSATVPVAAAIDDRNVVGNNVVAADNSEAGGGGNLAADQTRDSLEKYEWKKESGGWRLYVSKDSKVSAIESGLFLNPDSGNVYYFKGGYMQSGVISISANEIGSGGLLAKAGKYYFDDRGENPVQDKLGQLVKSAGWLMTKNGRWLFLDETGKVDETKTGIQTIQYGGYQYTYYLDANGIPQTGVFPAGSQFYYFDQSSGLQTTCKGWKLINNKWYWFENGAAVTGWRYIGGKWYHMAAATAAMDTGFFTAVDGKKYYSDSSGAMLGGGWHSINGKWYWMQSSGAMQTGWLKLGNNWYYMDSSGAMQTGWLKLGNTWYYLNGNGTMRTGWLKLGNTWYYLNGSGAMQTGWLKLGNIWYYLNSSGAMQTGWYQVNGKWYYSYSNGAMAANRWIGNYYVDNGGAMAVNRWIGPYWVGEDGKWIPEYGTIYYGAKWKYIDGKWYYELSDGTFLKNSWRKIDGKWYYLGSDGVMATGWRYIGRYKYYFKSSGELVQDLDSIIGWQSSYYITVDRVKNQVMVYAKDGNNGYTIPVKTFTCSVGLPETPTPTGTYSTSQKIRWHTLVGPSYGQYCTRIVGSILFHSVPGYDTTNYSINAADYNMLGSAASHGCIRLCVRDAKWIYDNCSLGTTVTIGDNLDAPFDKPAAIKIPASQNWDPTDPEVY